MYFERTETQKPDPRLKQKRMNFRILIPHRKPRQQYDLLPIQVIRPTDDTGDNDIIAVQPGIAEAPAPISNDEAAGGLEDPEGSIQIMKNVNGKFTDTSIFRIKSRKNAPQESAKTTKIKEESFTPAQHPDTYDNPFSEVSDDKERGTHSGGETRQR